MYVYPTIGPDEWPGPHGPLHSKILINLAYSGSVQRLKSARQCQNVYLFERRLNLFDQKYSKTIIL